MNKAVFCAILAANIVTAQTNSKTETNSKAADMSTAFSQSAPKTNTQPEPKLVLLTDLPEELVGIVKRDFRDCLPNNREAINEVFLVTHLNLGNEDQPAFLIANQCGGNDNGPELVYVRLRGNWQKVYEAVGNHLNVLQHPSKGLLDLERWMHGSAFDSTRFVYEFDGHVYRSVSCNDVRFADVAGRWYPKPRSVPCGGDWKSGNP